MKPGSVAKVENPKDGTFIFNSETANVQTPPLRLLVTSLRFTTSMSG